MKHFYTINYKLFAYVQDDLKLLDVQISDLAYKSRQNALQAVQERMKTHIQFGDYDRSTFNKLALISKDEKFRLEFEIKEHWLSEFEKES